MFVSSVPKVDHSYRHVDISCTEFLVTGPPTLYSALYSAHPFYGRTLDEAGGLQPLLTTTGRTLPQCSATLAKTPPPMNKAG